MPTKLPSKELKFALFKIKKKSYTKSCYRDISFSMPFPVFQKIVGFVFVLKVPIITQVFGLLIKSGIAITIIGIKLRKKTLKHKNTYQYLTIINNDPDIEHFFFYTIINIFLICKVRLPLFKS